MPMLSCSACVRWTIRVLIVASAGAAACGPGGLINTASLGGNTPGQRGDLQVTFINHTPFRAVFTYGVYDPQNEEFGADFFGQFSVDPDPALRLEGNTASPVVTLPCGRVFSIGGEGLIARIKANRLAADLSEEALQPGIAFSDKPLDDPEAGQATAGRAPAVLTHQGSQFPCDSLLIYTFEPDATQPSGVRVDLEVVLP